MHISQEQISLRELVECIQNLQYDFDDCTESYYDLIRLLMNNTSPEYKADFNSLFE